MPNIEEIEGIGAAYAKKLVAAGIKTTDDLLAAGATPKVGRNLQLRLEYRANSFLNGLI